MKTPTTNVLTPCICQHANIVHYSTLYADMKHRRTACRSPGCTCQMYVRDWWLARIVYRRLITAFARQSAPKK
jgi:hypothetical protein